MIYDLFDESLADILEVSVEEYINKIESTTLNRMSIIILNLLSEDLNKVKKAKKIFKLL